MGMLLVIDAGRWPAVLVISKIPAYQEWTGLRLEEAKPLPMFFPMIEACTGPATKVADRLA
jgi:hypothetical protein